MQAPVAKDRGGSDFMHGLLGRLGGWVACNNHAASMIDPYFASGPTCPPFALVRPTDQEFPGSRCPDPAGKGQVFTRQVRRMSLTTGYESPGKTQGKRTPTPGVLSEKLSVTNKYIFRCDEFVHSREGSRVNWSSCSRGPECAPCSRLRFARISLQPANLSLQSLEIWGNNWLLNRI